jgi:hypothetical protein
METLTPGIEKESSKRRLEWAKINSRGRETEDDQV